MAFRVYGEGDLARCTEAFVEVFNAEPWNDEWTLARADAYLLDFCRTPGFLGMVAAEGEEVTGFIFGVQRKWWSGDEFFIHEMCVKQQQQNQGVGRGLLQHVEKELSDRGVHSITLLTDRGIPAEAFYKKNGFEEIERIVFYARSLTD